MKPEDIQALINWLKNNMTILAYLSLDWCVHQEIDNNLEYFDFYGYTGNAEEGELGYSKGMINAWKAMLNYYPSQITSAEIIEIHGKTVECINDNIKIKFPLEDPKELREC